MECPVRWPGTMCSGRGPCVNGTCICSSGWVSHGDYLTNSNDCAIKLEAVRWLWIANLVLALGGLPFGIMRLRAAWRANQSLTTHSLLHPLLFTVLPALWLASIAVISDAFVPTGVHLAAKLGAVRAHRHWPHAGQRLADHRPVLAADDLLVCRYART